jgi:hypothetical protein
MSKIQEISKRCRDRRGQQIPSRTELIGHFGQVGVAKVGCSRNDKTERGTKTQAFFIHSEFDLQSSRRYVRYLQQPFCDHVLYIYKVNNFFSDSYTYLNYSRGLIIHTTLFHCRVKIKNYIIFFEHLMTT